MRLIGIILRWIFGPPAPPPFPPPPAPQPPSPGDPRGALLAAVNAVRARPLARNAALDGTAQAWADDLARRGGLPSHGDWYGRVHAAYPSPYVGEDIAAGQTSPAEVVADWLADPPHRRSITDPGFLYAGVGLATHPGGWEYWVLDLGG